MRRRDFIRHSLVLGCTLLFSPIPVRALGGREEPWRPAYEKLEKTGAFEPKVERAYAVFERCELCPRQCGVNRLKGELGFCRAPAAPVIYSAHPHYGEEESLVGERGSGTIFISNCNLRCVFCQNWPIAHAGKGKQIQDEDLAAMMLRLQEIGCHNINLVTPTHIMPNILRAVRMALSKGLHIPLVYNTSGYERLEMLEILDGVVDIYMPDMKYMDGKEAARYSSEAYDYPEITQRAIIEMNRQVGELLLDHRGVALRGLIIRHLVMPNRIAGTQKFVRWVARNLPKSTYLNIMPQYRVEYRAFEFPRIARGITMEEFLEAMDWAEQQGLTNLDPKSVAAKNFYRHLRSQ